MKKFCLAAFAAVSLVSCTKKAVEPALCAVLAQAVAGSAQAVAQSLSCTNQGAIAATLSGEIAKMNICTGQSQQGVIADLICPKITDAVVTMGVNSLPPAWGCTGTKAAANYGPALTAACQANLKF